VTEGRKPAIHQLRTAQHARRSRIMPKANWFRRAAASPSTQTNAAQAQHFPLGDSAPIARPQRFDATDFRQTQKIGRIAAIPPSWLESQKWKFPFDIPESPMPLLARRRIAARIGAVEWRVP